MRGSFKYLFFPLFIHAAISSGQANVVDSLEQIATTGNEVEKRTEALFELAAIFIGKNPRRSRSYSTLCIEIAEAGNDRKGLGNCLNAKGLLHYYQAEYDSAEMLFHRLIGLGRSENDTVFLYKAYGNLGLVYRSVGKTNEAVDYFLKSIRLNEVIGNQRAVAKLLSDVGGVYLLTANWKEAMHYQKKAMALFKKMENEAGVARVENAIGIAFQEQLLLDSAFYYFEKSLKTKEKIGDERAWVATKGNLCRLFLDMKNTEKAMTCFEELIPVEEKLGALSDLSTSLTNLALLHSEMGSYNEGIKLAKKSLQLAEEIDFKKTQRGASNALVELLEKKGNYKQALFYAHKARAVHDSLINENRTRQIAEIETKYETEKKEQQIALQQLEIENKNQKLYFQKILGAAVIAALLALFAFIFWRNKKQQESRRQQAEIKHQEQLLLATVESVEAERKRISKDLHDGIGQQLSGLKMAWQQFSDKLKNNFPNDINKLDSLSNILDDTASEVRNISHQMMPAALRQLGLVAALEDMLQKSFFNSSIKYEFEQVNADGRFSENIEIGLYRIAQELINNIIKHSNANAVSVELFKTKTHLVLTVEDDGKGFDMENMEGVGNGLNNINSRAKSVNGKIQFEQRSGRGTSATVRVPVLNG